jgi:hypothetical protein
MREMKIKRFKSPLRYEDIVDPNDPKPGLFRKLRLVLFLWRHPEELRRYDDAFKARVDARYGKGWCDNHANPSRRELRELKTQLRVLRKKMYAARQDRRELAWEAGEYAKHLKEGTL